MRADMNSAFQALASNSSGSVAPSVTYPYQWWYDDGSDKLKIRNSDNDAWIDFALFNQVSDTWQVLVDGDAVTSSADELNILDGADTSFAPLLLAQPTAFIDPDNRIINGAFDFWQRGTSGTGSGYVAADRWVNGANGGTVTQSRQAHTVGDKFGSNSPQFYLRQSVSGQSAASHLAISTQRIEGVRSYAGETITLLGWARRSSGSGNMVVEVEQDFGTGGSPSATVSAISLTTITLTTDWEPFAAVITVPSITGKTLGTNGNDRLQINFWTSAGSDFNARTNSLGIQTIGVDLWGIHIKRGTHTADATEAYRAPELGPELARCQRYFQRIDAEFKHDGVLGTSSVSVGHSWFFSVAMRTVPSVSVLVQSQTNAGIILSVSAKEQNAIFAIWEWTSGTALISRNKAATLAADAEL
jgi:hypothetical protein